MDGIEFSETKMKKKLLLASATWCGPCHALKMKMGKENLLDKVEMIDADNDIEKFKELNIKSVPRLLMIDESSGSIETIYGIEDIISSIKDSI